MNKENTFMNGNKLNQVGKFYDKVAQANKDYFSYWLDNTFLRWDFWISLGLTVIPWILFILFRKKDSTHRLLYVGLFAVYISSWLDFLGVTYGLWYYTGKVIPTIPSYVPWDFSIIPVFIILLIQYKPKIKAYWKGLFFAGVATFIGEPLFKWLGFYVEENWNILYSFPLYFLIYLACYKLSKVDNFEQIK